MLKGKTVGQAALRALVLLALMVATARAQNADRVNELFELMDDMGAAVTRVEDTIAIQRLQRAYGYYIDKGYWNEAADLFTSTATLEVGVDGVYIGSERIRQMLVRYGDGSPDAGPGLRFGQMNRHMQLQPVVTIGQDGTTAQARWRNLSLLGQYLQNAYWGDTILENTYRKENGVWKIQSLHLYPNFVAPYRGGWAVLEAAAEDWRSAASREVPPDAPPTFSYRPFPEQHTVPFHYNRPANRARQQSWVSRLGNIGEGSGPLAEIERRLLDYARELDNLIAEREIENLQAMYGYYIDNGMWDEAAGLFSDNASYEFGQSGVYVGRDRVRQAIGMMGPEGLEPGMLNNYPMLQPVINVAADNRSAQGRWRSDVMLSRGGVGRWGGGVYENEYILDDGIWKISKLHYYVTFWADYDAGWNEGALPMEGRSPTLPPDLPPTMEYEAFPSTHLFPFHYNHPVTGLPHDGQTDEAGDAP